MPATDLSRNRLRSHLEAFLLEAGNAATHQLHGRAKQNFLGALTGTVVEIGPGTGVNMPYYAPGVRVIGIEPNTIMHPRLLAAAAAHDVDLEVRTLAGEQLDVEDGSVDAVVGTLVLCGVENPAKVLAEVHRVLRPTGRYFFVEHVAAPDGTRLRRVQDAVMPVHRWLFNGCEVNRDTAATIRAAGFSHVAIDEVVAGPQALHVRTQIRGVATR